MEKLAATFIKEFQDSLLYWFERNMRDLPWRQDKDPYKIWVSEVMLQQTKVDTVIPYFERFMDKYPTLQDLAQAPVDEVLKEWEGLGYYSRARNLHHAVREVAERYGGSVPDNVEEISTLKGVGEYTAGAILSIAYGQAEPAVDGNVLRVISRIFAIAKDISKSATKKEMTSLVRQLISQSNPSYFNQALMELGALICTPRSPQCLLCPVQKFCQGRKEGIEQTLPIKSPKKKPKAVHMAAGVLVHEGKVLIRQRAETGLLARLFEFPNLEWQEADPAETISRYLYEEYALKTVTVEEWPSVEHIFSHLIWNITVYKLRLADDQDAQVSLPANCQWLQFQQLDDFAFSVSHQKIKNHLLKYS